MSPKSIKGLYKKLEMEAELLVDLIKGLHEGVESDPALCLEYLEAFT